MSFGAEFSLSFSTAKLETLRLGSLKHSTLLLSILLMGQECVGNSVAMLPI
jgi:hypothetical protein